MLVVCRRLSDYKLTQLCAPYELTACKHVQAHCATASLSVATPAYRNDCKHITAIIYGVHFGLQVDTATFRHGAEVVLALLAMKVASTLYLKTLYAVPEGERDAQHADARMHSSKWSMPEVPGGRA